MEAIFQVFLFSFVNSSKSLSSLLDTEALKIKIKQS